MNNKLIIGIVIVIIVGIVSLVLSNSYFHQIAITQVQPVSTPSLPRHLSINLIENMQITQSP
ncbi:MAG: hypothetical protein WBV92_05080 [Nitrosotalea sp.]